MKIRLVEAKLFHAVGRTDTTKVTVTFRVFANAPKNRKHSPWGDESIACGFCPPSYSHTRYSVR